MGFEDLDEYRDEFPVTQELIYLNHAAVSPLSRRAAEAMKFLADDALHFGSLHYEVWLEAYAGLRRSAASLVGARSTEIAIVKNTSEGVSTIAEGFPWRTGDRMVAFKEEFPANIFPWKHAAQRHGFTIDWLSIYDPLDEIEETVPGARLLAISFVNYLSGFRAPLKEIGEICRRNDCFFFVDAIQGLGVYPLQVDDCRIDALAADGHKWLTGPEGQGVLYVRREWQDQITPPEIGWTNRVHASDHADPNWELRRDAGRYECGTLNTIGCFGLRAAIDLINEIRPEQIARKVDALASRLEAGLADKGYKLIRNRNDFTGSGIVTVQHPSRDSASLAADLKKRGMIATARGEWLRFSPHFYLTEPEIDGVVAAMPAL